MMHHPHQIGSTLKLNVPEAAHHQGQYQPHSPPQALHFDKYETNPDRFSPKGNVAALRNVIHGQLDMKTPSKGVSDSSRFQKPAPPPADTTPSWAKNVKVYEPNGYVDPHLNKHNMGRVLDGPVNPNKFFQGVPPPSYSQVKSIDAKPPAPPSKPPIQTTAQSLQAQVLQGQNVENIPSSSSFSLNAKRPSDPYRLVPQKTSYRIPYDMSLDPRLHTGEFDVDDSASIISSCISTFGESSEIAGFSAAAEQRHLYEQYRKKLLEEKNELKEGRETPSISQSDKVHTSSKEPNQNPGHQSSASPQVLPSRSIFETELTPFGHTSAAQNDAIASASFQNQNQSNPFGIQPSHSTNVFRVSPISPTIKDVEIRKSADLETSQLLIKPKSPAPYSTSSSDHYGTIRRKHKPVAVDLSESSKSSPSNRSPSNLFFGANFEGTPETSRSSSQLTPTYLNPSSQQMNRSNSLKELHKSFETASSPESTKNNYDAQPKIRSTSHDRSISDTYPVSSQQQEATQWTSLATPSAPANTTTTTTAIISEQDPPSAQMSTSMNSSVMSTNMDDSIVHSPVQEELTQQPPKSSADSSPDGHEDMSQWYRKMFKQMHRKGDDNEKENEKQRFVNTTNLRIGPVTPTGNKSLDRNQENSGQLQYQQQPIGSAANSSAYFDNLEHGPIDQPAYGQERVKQSNEEELLRLKAEKLAEELKREKERKHGFIPSATPALQNNMDRLNSLLYDFSNEAHGPTTHKDYSQNPVMTATAIYKFEPRSSRELSLNRGDIVRVIRDVDAYWIEGERNGRSGIFPASYVQINSPNHSDTRKMRAIYPFTARSDAELSLRRGEIVTCRRQVDSNWLEGSNQIGIVGIFPASYVQPLEPSDPEVIPTVASAFPNRPKTPKMEEQVYSNKFLSVGEPASQNQTQNFAAVGAQGYHSKPVEFSTANNKVRFDLPSSSDSNLQMSRNPIQNQNQSLHQPLHQQQQPASYGMKKIEYDREKIDEEPILNQYRKLNDEPKPTQNTKQDNSILVNAASLIPKGSEMYRAVYPYQPQKDDELQLYTNDIIFVVEKCDDGWYIGTSLRTGDFGIFPGNYVKRH